MVFDTLVQPDPDPILALGSLFRDDVRQEKLNLGIGVYRDEAGETPVMRSVREAERYLHATRTSKSYIGPQGDVRFAAVMRDLVFGDGAPIARIGALQTPGGTGALRIVSALLACARPDATVWLSDPTWPNHQAIVTDVGLRTAVYPYYDKRTGEVSFDAMMTALHRALPGDVVLLQGSCHNPTGADLGQKDWTELTDLLLQRCLIPLVDLAYQGLGRGLDEDASGVRYLAERVPEMLVATSCSKNFGIYSERTGCSFVLAAEAHEAETATAQMVKCARTLYSMPPDHGGAIVRTICADDALLIDWRNELEEMRRSVESKRQLLTAALRDTFHSTEFNYLAGQVGMFSILNLSRDEIDAVRRHHGIYLVRDGRINIAGLGVSRIPEFAQALASIHRRLHAAS